MRNIFSSGFNLPPGVKNSDFDMPFFCETCCTTSDDDCICPECPICGEVGRKECYTEHGMVFSKDQLERQKKFEEQRKKEAEAESRMAEEQIKMEKEEKEAEEYMQKLKEEDEEEFWDDE